MQALFAATRHAPNVGLYLVPAAARDRSPPRSLSERCWQQSFSGRDGLRAVPFFPCYKGQLIYGTTEPVPPGVSREDHWSFYQDLEGVRSLGAVLVDASSVFAATRHGTNVGPLLVSAAARDRSPPSQERLSKLYHRSLRMSAPPTVEIQIGLETSLVSYSVH
jgi:hypothetical protein